MPWSSKALALYRRHITVSNCQLHSSCHGIKFGTESVGGFEFIAVHNCSVWQSPYPDACGHKHTGSRLPITGVAIECTDGGTLRHVSVDGLVVEGVYAPFFVKLGNRMDRRLAEDPEDMPAGILEDVSIAHVTGTAVGTFAPSISGYRGHPVRRITVRDCHLSFAGGITADEILHDLPEHSELYPEIHVDSQGPARTSPSGLGLLST